MTAPSQAGYLALWDAVAAAVPDRECIVQGARRRTWAQTRQRTLGFGRWLAGTGAGARAGTPAWESPNDLVGVLVRNRPEYLEATIGCYRARCAPFNVNYRYTATELAYLLDDARPAALVFQQEFGPVVGDALARSAAARPELVVVRDDSGAQIPAGAVHFDDVADSADRSPLPEPSADDVHVLYTGGTTGMPKGVLWRQRDVIAAAGIAIRDPAEAAAGAVRRSWLRAFPAPPLMHGASLWFAFNAWARGATLVLDPNESGFDGAAAVRLMADERVAWLAVIGDAFATPLLDALAEAEDLPPLSYVFSSGAVLSERSWAGLRGHYPDLKIVNTLGSSETGPQAFQTASGQAEFRPGPHTVVVNEDQTALLSADEPGTGWLANGGTLPRGYLNDETRTRSTFRAIGSVRVAVSGDRAAIDEAGTIVFLGREATVINTGGEKVYAEEVEQVLRRLGAVRDVVVVGRPSERWGSEVTALVVLDSDVDDVELSAHCRESLAGYKVPKTFVRVPAVSRAPNGKVDYAWARDVAASAGSPATA